MIKVLVEIELVYPFTEAIVKLIDFNILWRCSLISGSTNSNKAIILMPLQTFKRLFGSNPEIKKYPPPIGAEYFMVSATVKKIKAK